MRDLLERVEKMLTALEFAKSYEKFWSEITSEFVNECPLCASEYRHAPDCDLASLLAEVRRELKKSG